MTVTVHPDFDSSFVAVAAEVSSRMEIVSARRETATPSSGVLVGSADCAPVTVVARSETGTRMQ
jgi:hypothetical protein